MNFAAAEKIADAVLFEGYILYPYRPSSIKNQKRWNFGTLFPRGFVETEAPEETWSLHAEVLLQGDQTSKVTARVRFLELGSRDEKARPAWEEGFVRIRDVEAPLQELCDGVERDFDLGALTAAERDRAPSLHRHNNPMVGNLSMRAESISEGLYLLCATFANESPGSRNSFRHSAFVSAHLLLHAEGGEFVSLLDPEESLKAVVCRCKQRGVFPVLAGEVGSRNCMLCSPIILYDYPQVAPESAGDFFDGTEMDEMLALRVMTLTDEEKSEMRRSDSRARAILDRTEMLPPDHLVKLHGAVRSMRPVVTKTSQSEIDGEMEAWDPFADRPPLESVRVFGVDVHRGDRVRLWPQKKADIMDMAMEGKIAVVEAIEQDLDDQIQFAVVLDDDPGRDMGMMRQAGHRFFFSPEEIEPISMELL